MLHKLLMGRPLQQGCNWTFFGTLVFRQIQHGHPIKGALYRIWCGVNRLGDSGVKVV